MSETYCGLLNIIVLSILAGSHAVLQARLRDGGRSSRRPESGSSDE